MVLYSDLKPFKFDYKQLPSVAYYYWMSEYILANYKSENYSINILYNMNGGYGAHWGGFMLGVDDKNGVRRAFCHTGLVYHPGTETGIYFEAESIKNPDNYEKLRKDVEPCKDYDLNMEEPDFIKFFYPKDRLSELMDTVNIKKQIELLTKYYDACFKGIINAALR